MEIISGAIDRVHKPTWEEFDKNYVKKCKPAIITGMLDDWKALERWNDMDYIRKKVGHRKVPVMNLPEKYADVTYSDWAGMFRLSGIPHMENLEVNEYLDLLASSDVKYKGQYYLGDVMLKKFLPELMEDIEDIPLLEDFNDGEDSHHYRVLFFGQDSYTHTHMHITNQALLCQAVGVKKMLMFAPDQARNLHPYPMTTRENSPFVTQANMDDPDFVKHPRMKKAKALEMVVNAGEIAFIPTYWWHAVYSPGLSIGVTKTYLNRPGWGLRYPFTGSRCFLARNLVNLANLLGWRNDPDRGDGGLAKGD